MRHLGDTQIAHFAQAHAVILLHHESDATLDGRQVGSLADEAEAAQRGHHCMWVADDEAEEQVLEALLCGSAEGADHAEVDKGDGGLGARRAGDDENIARVWIGVEEADLEELIEVGFDCAFRDFEPTDAGRLQLGVVVDLDAIHPFQHQDAPRGVAVDDARDQNAGSVGKDRGEPARVGCLLDIVDLFEDRPPEFAIKRSQVDEFVGVDKA